MFKDFNDKPIRKAAAAIIRDGKILITRPKKGDYWLSPGGKYEEGESAEQCLKRELKEEIDSGIVSFKHFKTYHTKAVGKNAGRDLILELYLVEIIGDPKASSEIESVVWMSMKEFKEKKHVLAPTFYIFVPDLIQSNLLPQE